MTYDGFEIVDQFVIPAGQEAVFRRRLGRECDQNFYVRLNEAHSVMREVWQNPAGQRFTIVWKRGFYVLLEIRYDDAAVVERTHCRDGKVEAAEA